MTADDGGGGTGHGVQDCINGECYADDSAANHYFPVERLLSEATKWFAMKPGDCIRPGIAFKGTEKLPKGNIGTDLGH